MHRSPPAADSVAFVEVSARDGLQNEATPVSTGDKLRLISRAVAAGVRRLEVASFVNARRVPQMADAEAVVADSRAEGVTRIGLVLNLRGAERALATDVEELGAVCAASDGFARANQGRSADETVEDACAILDLSRREGRSAQATISVAFGCPFDGAVDPARVVAVARRLAAERPVEVAVADTIGIARPGDVADLVARVAEAVAPLPVRVHLHDTRGMAVANAWAAVEAGARVLDGSIAGVGGCPFAPGATGNVASESLAYALGERLEDGRLDLDALVETAAWLNGLIGRADATGLMRVARRAASSARAA